MSKIILALDNISIDDSIKVVDDIKSEIYAVKLGIGFFYKYGIDGLKAIREKNMKVFLDLKLCDIPNTIETALNAVLSEVEVSMVTIHINAGAESIKRSLSVIESLSLETMLLGVTVLTSVSNENLHDMGYKLDLDSLVVDLARFANNNGLHGIVCSGHEISIVRKETSKNFKIVVPGIYIKESNSPDQSRIMCYSNAVRKGADFLVIGRSILKTEDPVHLIKEVNYSINNIL
ncbi:MAG: orotidine 5'-phosphate decarboxylase [Candidatus Xenolissoclinum pacificiensis L6]|uniref:Orotidine 5'-phosphate decarboxylase n=1 Tax=Candidatus Xenolissoclinum pacificiensis L6 TaxID=1401685 RepID=W2V2T3_9RICK|nr:MAG: orotidine 5'-phosphate decarboxylase [Candidatus Xenolissoclinum pacificiensis L6]